MARNSPHDVLPQEEGINEDNIYSGEAVEESLYQDEIDLHEAGFMQGYEQADTIEQDSVDTELSEEDLVQTNEGGLFSSESEG